MSYLINIDEKRGFLGQEGDVLDILQYHPGLAGHNPLVFNFFVKKMSSPPFLRVIQKKD